MGNLCLSVCHNDYFNSSSFLDLEWIGDNALILGQLVYYSTLVAGEGVWEMKIVIIKLSYKDGINDFIIWKS